MTSTASRVIKNSGFLYIRIAVVTFLSLYTTRLILDVLGASDFGIYSIVGGVIAMLGFLNGAMASATQRFMSYSEGENDREKQKRIFNISLRIHLAISLLLVLLLLVAGIICFIYMKNIGWYMSAEDVACIFADVFLLTMFGTALSSVVNLFLSSQGQMQAVGTIVSAGYGFICGAYMPIASFGEGLQKVLMFLPGTY